MESADRDGIRVPLVRPELQPLVDAVDFVPDRVSVKEVPEARKLVKRDGAVILTGSPVEPDSAVRAAAAMLGTRLRQLERIRQRTTEDWEAVTFHRDWGHIAVQIHEQTVFLRIPDPDFVCILCASPAPAGGESVVLDGYRLAERIKSDAPQLYQFLTTIDVDITSTIQHRPDDVFGLPRVSRMLEWTRGGRMVIQVAQTARPAPSETHREEHQTMIDLYNDVIGTALASAQEGTILERGEILFLDNYRCLHGVRAHEGSRTTYVLRCKSSDAL